MHTLTSPRLPRRTLVLGILIALIGFLVVAAIPPPQGDPPQSQFIAILTPGQVASTNGTQGFGVAHMVLRGGGMLDYSISYHNMNGPEISAHFHGPAGPGMTAGIQASLPQYMPGPATTPKNGTLGPLTPQQVADLLNGLWYIDIHTTAPGGVEIRGQVLRAR